MNLSDFTADELYIAMVQAGYKSYAALAAKVKRTPQAVARVIKREVILPSKSLEQDIFQELSPYLTLTTNKE